MKIQKGMIMLYTFLGVIQCTFIGVYLTLGFQYTSPRMNRIITIFIILGLGWYGNYKYHTIQQQQQQLQSESSEQTEEYVTNSTSSNSLTSNQFKCDGRTHCSQMTSCEEATFFINNCPNTEMDGNNDGVPCEKQWCKY